MLEAGQSSTAMSEMHSRPTMLAYSERAGVYGSQPIPSVMAEDREPVTYIEEAPDQDRQRYHREALDWGEVSEYGAVTDYGSPSPYGKVYEHDEEKEEPGESDIAPGRVLERERQFKQDLERRPREANSKPKKRSYLGTPEHALLRDHKEAAADFSEDYATREARYLEQRARPYEGRHDSLAPGAILDILTRSHEAKHPLSYSVKDRALKFGHQEGEEPTRNDKDNPDRFHRKKMKYTISEDLTEGRSRRLKAKYLAFECSQSSSLYALRR